MGEGVPKAYFAGRQLGRVVAAAYDEIMLDHRYGGQHHLERSLPPFVVMAEQALPLGQNQRARTGVRVAAGGGSETNLNWMLNRGYFLLSKVHHWQRG